MLTEQNNLDDFVKVIHDLVRKKSQKEKRTCYLLVRSYPESKEGEYAGIFTDTSEFMKAYTMELLELEELKRAGHYRDCTLNIWAFKENDRDEGNLIKPQKLWK